MNSTLPKIRIISVSRPKAAWQELCADYSARLAKLTNFEHIVVKEKGSGEADVRSKTSDEIRSKIPKDYSVVLLDERGKQITSVFFASQMAKSSKPICFIIGSSYGVDEDLRTRADLCLGLSKMVLPHELARVMLLEQLYRANAILSGHPYHHS